MGLGLLLALEGGDVKKCVMTDIFVFLEFFTCRARTERCGTSELSLAISGWGFCMMSEFGGSAFMLVIIR